MKHFIDAITAADNDAQRRQITRDQLGMQEMNWESFGLGALAGWLIAGAITDIIEGFASRNSYDDPYFDDRY